MQEGLIVKSKLLRAIFIIVLAELALFGSGQMLKIGPVTMRMLLFVFTTLLSLLIIFTYKRVEKYFAKLVFLFSLVLGMGIFIGLINHNPIALLLEDIKPLIFFFSILFFSLVIKDVKDILLVNKIIKNASIVLGIVYLTLLIVLLLGYVNFLRFYAILSATGEFYFRGSSAFFYKGFLYLCIGSFFFMDRFSVKNIIALLFVFTAIVLTFTRGFILSLALVGIIYFLIISKRKIISFFILMLISIPIGFLIPAYLNAVGNKSSSDNERFVQIAQVEDAIDPISFFIGHGFGQGTVKRPVHMEISFLEIFHKQGLLGVFFWITIFVCICYSFYKADLNGNRKLALPFLLSTIFIYLQTMTNPYLNNPIGMSVVIISLIVLKRLENSAPNLTLT
jgi:hypothetical protein